MSTPRAQVRMLENLAFRTWLPEEIHLVGGWALGASGGFSRAANCVQALGDPGLEREKVLEALEAWYLRRRLPPCARISPATPDWVDPFLKEKGWKLREPTSAMTLSLAAFEPLPTRRSVSVFSMPPMRWLHLSGDWEDVDPPQMRAYQGVLQRIPSPSFLTLRDGNEPVGLGICALDGGDAYLYGIAVDPRQRGKGVGLELMFALFNLARSKSAVRALVQLPLANLPARKLCDRLGFEEAYRFHYRELPLEG